MIVTNQDAVSSTFTNNTINGTEYGVGLYNVPTTSTITFGPTNSILNTTKSGLFITDNLNFNPIGTTNFLAATPAPSTVTLTGVAITPTSGNGVRIDRSNGTNPAAVSATIQTNCEINQTGQIGTGVLIQGSSASAIIKDNISSINGMAIGIDVDGGSATIENNHIYDNGIGVRFINSGTGTVKTNKFFDALPNGKDLQLAVNAGAVTATDNNWFAGSTYGVENLRATDVDATLNYWNAANGPGLVGPGSGAKITTKVLYCQYLNGIPVPLGGTGAATSPTVTIVVTETSGTPNDGTICNGASATLDATTAGATAYAWSTGATTASIIVSPGTTTTYTVTVTFAGCTVTDDQEIIVNPLPSCTITGTNGPVCPNSTNNFDGPAGLSYAWSITGNGSISGSTTMQTVTVTSGALCNNSFTLTLITTDGNSCTSSCTKTVNVLDNTPPVITTGTIAACYPSVALAEAAALAATTATDACPGTLTETASTSGTCSATITVTVTDACSNSATTTYSTRIDGTGPALTCPGNITINAATNLCGKNAHYTDPTATDNCSGPITIVQTDNSGFINHDFFPVGVTIQSFQATDGCGNSTTCSFTVTVVDNQMPIITGCPTNIVKSTDPGLCTAITGWVAPTASDNCPGVVMTLTPNLPPGSAFPKGVTALQYKATDASGNMTTCNFTVTVNDNELPVITCPTNI
ncbi:MAG: HYR domain-containing protein, partial [Saprospiraceae bacterium]|nr:HYR domain-containing protein [Candidatus Defluviibacterium haderslevense]